MPTNPRFTGTPPLRVWRMDEMGAALFNRGAHEMGTAAVNWRAVVHPRTGFLYVANNEGVFEFDGVRWRMIRLPHGRGARNVLVAADGRVWATGPGTVVVLEPADPAAGERAGELVARDVSSRLPPAVLATVPAAPVAAKKRDADAVQPSALESLTDANPTLLATPEGVYLRLHRFLVRFGSQGQADAWATPETSGRLWWSGGSVHVSVPGRGIHRLDDGRLQPTAITGDARVWDTVKRSDGSWVWLTTSGPRRVEGDAATPLISAAARALLSSEQILDALALPDGTFAYATSGQGLVVLDRDGGLVEVLDAERGLPGDRINGLALDREGGLWLAMHNALARVQHDSGIASHGLAQGLRGIPQELAGAGDQVYVTHSEGLTRRDPVSGRLEAVPGLKGFVNQAAPVGGDLLAAGQGVWSVPPGGAAALVTDRAQRWTVTASRTEPGAAFVSGRSELSFLRRNPADAAHPWSVAFRFQNMISPGLDSVHDNGTGFVWMVGYPDRNIRRLDVRAGVRPDAPLTTFGAEHGLPVMKETDKVLLLPTGGALFAVRRQGGAWRWDEARMRFDPEPLLLRDGAGPNSLRASATSGWLYFPTPTPLFRRISVGTDGALASEDYPVPALGGIPGDSLLPAEGQHTLWITSQTGLVSFDFARKTHRPADPPVATLRRVGTTDGTTLWVAPPFAAPSSTVALTLAPAQRDVRIEFTLPSFEADLLARGKLQFRSRATGIDRDWTPWSTEAHRDVTNLPDGAFAFEVEARDALGRTSAASRLEFQVLPPWWRTPPARVGWVMLGAVLVSGFVWGRTRTLRRRNIQLEAVVAARTAELERLRQIDRDESAAAKLAEEKTRLEMLRYQLNPHFLYNALNSIRALIFSRPPAAGDMVSQLADLCRVTLTRNEEVAPVSEEFAMLRLYLDMEKTRWRDKLAVEIELAPEAAARPIPPFLLLPLVENALKHGRQTTAGVLRLRLGAQEPQPGVLLLEIANTGEWLAPGQSTAPSTGIGPRKPAPAPAPLLSRCARADDDGGGGLGARAGQIAG